MEVEISKYITEIFETPSKEFSEWFGYYNYDTLNYNQDKILCNRSSVDGISPTAGMTIELGYYDVLSREWHHIGDTDSWNWQQGAMLQWMPGLGNENKVIFNCSENNHLISIIHDIKTHEDKCINWAIYGLTPDGKKSIALDLERSFWCRAYHYQSVKNLSLDGNLIDGDGVFEIDLENNSRKLLISISDILALDSIPEFSEMKHWVEHIMINQDGSQFCFLHRFSPSHDVNAYQTRLLIANIDGSNLQVVKGWDKVDWSHFGWNHNEFAIYTVQNNKIGTAYKTLEQNSSQVFDVKRYLFQMASACARKLPASIRKKIKGGKSYYQYYVKKHDGKYTLNRLIKIPIFDIDGHPSFTNDGKYMITDTYPDNQNNQSLIVYNLETNKALVLAKFYAYYANTPITCDLHPKLCNNNKYVAVDSAHDDKHHLMLFEIQWELIKEKIG